ncbi:MAG: hypothetical protein M3Y41_22130 [Pseudomonadota bacterium]|nr:hypothetical protein [Pseudomonadota bacterium]
MFDFRLEAQDEYPHHPDGSANFNESVYVNAASPEVGVGGWMRLGNRVGEGYAELSVCLYLPDGRIACQFARPSIATNERFEAGGLAYEVIEPLRRVRMTYEGELMVLDNPGKLREPARLSDVPRVAGSVAWELSGISPVHGGEPASATTETMYGRDFSLGHFNQHGRAAGHIRVGGQEWHIEGGGWRDHSWGPRYWQAIHCYRLFLATFADDRAFMLLKIADKSQRARRVGVLLVDGEYEEVIDLDVVTEWTATKEPARVRLGVRTARRAECIEGEVVSLAPLRNRRRAEGEVLVSRVAEGFTRFTWNGATTYGMCEYIERIVDGEPIGYPL